MKMPKQIKIGFIGFGKVASELSKGLQGSGLFEIWVYDKIVLDPVKKSKIEERAKELNVKLSKDNGSLTRACKTILCTVTIDAALEAAKETALFLNEQKTYIDLNSTSPGMKREIAHIIEKTGANFIEGAILGAIGSYGFQVPIMVCGKKAKKFQHFMNQIGMSITYIGQEIGKASTVKMLRSVFAKGVEALLVEMLQGAVRYGVESYVMEDISRYMDNHSFLSIANDWLITHPIDAERRFWEMEQVVKTLREVGINPIMATATREKLKASVALKLKEFFKGGEPEDYHQVIAAMEAKTLPK
ncbi:NAD(P)-dependent oxidoreductase [Patescibacteria group bacterium]|nr:NAD(P)-dependent oxidoreductase [Patescibacteria group bacterium]